MFDAPLSNATHLPHFCGSTRTSFKSVLSWFTSRLKRARIRRSHLCQRHQLSMLEELLKGGSALIFLGAVAYQLRELPRTLWSMFERLFMTSLDIQNDDEAFTWLNLWLAKHLREVHSIAVSSRNTDENSCGLPADDESPVRRPQIIFSPTVGVHIFRFERKWCFLRRSRGEVKDRRDYGRSVEAFNIKVLSRDLSVARRLVESARDFAIPDDGKIEIRISRDGYWQSLARTNKRPIDSVIMPDGLKESLLADICNFRLSRNWYAEMGIPYRRGYLLAGKPGTGKSSLALALASHLDMGLSILSLSAQGMSDSTLLGLLSSADTNSIVFIEDVDCAFVQRHRGEDREKSVDTQSFSGLLNALDGVYAGDGRILFMTTNHPEKLDEALIRPGRADVRIDFGDATAAQAESLFKRFFPSCNGEAKQFVDQLNGRISMAAIQGHLIKHRENIERAVRVSPRTVGPRPFDSGPRK